MYEKFYQFTEIPFQLTPDSRFFFGSKAHSRAISHLTFGLAQGEGFIIVTGEVGAGKTTLVERLWAELDPRTYVLARINTTQVSGNELFRLAMAGFGLVDPNADKATLLIRFEHVLREHRLAGRRCLLVIDEVQNLSFAALEELRMLSNITEGGRASMQTILLGQPQFRQMLASPDLDQLRQRVLASYHLGPLTHEETRAYIEHRLQMVGWNGANPAWDPAAFDAVFRFTGGIPRRINRLCSRILLYGALEETMRITGVMAEETATELQQDLEAGSTPGAPSLSPGAAGGQQGGFGGLNADALRAALAPTPSYEAPLRELTGRVAQLEEQVARRERAFQRILEMLGTSGVSNG